MNLAPNAREVLLVLFLNGPTYDGDVPSKIGRDALFDHGLISRGKGYQWLTDAGVLHCLTLKFDLERALRRRAAVARDRVRAFGVD